MSEAIAFRRAVGLDRDAILRLTEYCLGEFGFEVDLETSESDLIDLEHTYRDPGYFEIAEDARGRLLGCCGLAPSSPMDCKLRKMYVEPAARGTGLGRALLQRFLERAAERGFRKVVLETTHRMQAAMRLYERNGFRRIDGHAASPRCDRIYAKQIGVRSTLDVRRPT